MSKKKGSRKAAGDGEVKSKGHGGGGAGPMDVGLLEQIVQLMTANDLNTVDVRDGGRRIVLKRGPAVVAAPMGMGMGAPPYAPPYHTPASPPSSPSAPPLASGSLPPASGESDAGLVAIKSPMVGTFYAAATPEAKPFVSVGSRVDEDTDVCIIEAMKVFNNIKAETRGTVAKVLIANGQTVEFGQALFLVKPD